MTTLLQIAAAEIGTTEVGGNNLGPRVAEYQRATWLAPGAWPWCAAFTAWCLREWLHTPEGVLYLQGRNPDKWRCQDASAFGWIKWAAGRKLEILPWDGKAAAGDIVVFDFNGSSSGGGHIGIVEKDVVDPFVYSVDGNTNDAGARDSTTGDGVWQKRRHTSLVLNYIRLGEHAP